MAQTNVQAFSGDVEISSNLSVGTTTFNACPIIGRVGIGTTNPETNFHIYSGGYLKNNYIQKFLGNGPEQAATYVLLLKNDNTPKSLSGKVYGVRGFSSVSANFGATLNVSVTSNGTIDARMTFEYTGIGSFYCKLVTLTYDSGSYIALAILPTANFRGVSGGIYFDGKLTNGNGLQYITDLDTLSNITDYTATNEDRITFTGNVGIGTTSPLALLHIHDPTDMTTSSEVLRLNRGSTGTDIKSNSRGTIGMYLQDTATPYEVARISWQHDGDDSSTEGLGKLGFWTSDTSGGGPDERMTIDKDGNVGIGITSPQTYLHLSAKNSNPGATEGDFVGSHNLTEYFRFTSTGDSGDVNSVSVGFKLGADDNDNSSPDGRLDICANDGSGADNSFGSIPDRTIATFLGGGNVGIGTTEPKQLFDVGINGYGVISGRLGVGNVLTAAQSGNQDHWNLGTSAKLVVRSPQGSDTTVSYANARTYAGIALVPEFDASDTTNMGLWGAGSGENPVFYIQGQVNNGANGGGRIALQPVAGNVGIGVTNPSQKLHVNGNLQVGNTFIKYGSAGGVSSGTGIYTGIGANGGSGGGFVLLVASWHTSSGSATGSFALAIRKQYSGAENKYPYNNYNQLHFNDGSAVNSYTLYTDSGSVLKFLFNATIAVCKWFAIEI